jgi:hypothetical protein
MENDYSIKKLLVLRRLTRAVADLLHGQMREYIATLTPLLRPRAVLGHLVEGGGGGKETVHGADKALAELQTLYEAHSAAKPFNLRKELKQPLEIAGTSLETTPLEYAYEAQAEGTTKTVTITSPLTWVLSYAGLAPGRLIQVGFTPKRFREVLADRGLSKDELHQFVVHYLVLHVVATRQVGVAKILDALHFPLGSRTAQELGNLPLTTIASAISTVRPPDGVIIESTEISGTDAFEEVVNLDQIARLGDPLKHRLIELARSHDAGLLPGASD